ncbi:hypothetical protein HGRIS_005076 [Hohenbuehelia grisea]|uniref:Fungal lipase-type domain-containing protein n=1 Tax=Hohenbuehelia grisea TaxID=104357 RepID=A0ABR3JEL0_9AGAR
MDRWSSVTASSFMTTMLLFTALSLLLLTKIADAKPALLQRRAAITALLTTEISFFRPFSFYANAAYCGASATLSWTCGPTCAANPSFLPTASGGDGDAVQFWYVGFDPTLNTVIVAHQGTDPSHLLPILTDIDIAQEKLDKSLFRGLDSSIKVHSGFAAAHKRAATGVLAAVQRTIAAHSVNTVTIVGHSLGAAIALLDSVYLPLNIPGATFKTILYGLPRVGNQKFADYVDSHVNLKHIRASLTELHFQERSSSHRSWAISWLSSPIW